MSSYDTFLSNIYDYSPFFGGVRTRDIEKFNSFYFESMAPHLKVLEFGSATGQLTIPLARAGYRIDSVDISPDMYDVLKRKLSQEELSIAKNVRPMLQDAIAYRGEELYDAVVMAEGILVAIPDRELQIGLLRSCYANLKPGGRVYTDLSQPLYNVIFHKTLTEYTRFRDGHGDVFLLEVEQKVDDPYSQILDMNCTYTKMEKGQRKDVTNISVQFRYLFYSELQLMFRLCGFKILSFDPTYADGRGFAIIAEKQ
jgi:SAM-dependent methyltransferase